MIIQFYPVDISPTGKTYIFDYDLVARFRSKNLSKMLLTLTVRSIDGLLAPQISGELSVGSSVFSQNFAQHTINNDSLSGASHLFQTPKKPELFYPKSQT